MINLPISVERDGVGEEFTPVAGLKPISNSKRVPQFEASSPGQLVIAVRYILFLEGRIRKSSVV